MLLLLHNAAANAVLYMYCKALHGELAFEIAEEFAREYVSLPFDDEKVPHGVTVEVEVSGVFLMSLTCSLRFWVTVCFMYIVW